MSQVKAETRSHQEQNLEIGKTGMLHSKFYISSSSPISPAWLLACFLPPCLLFRSSYCDKDEIAGLASLFENGSPALLRKEVRSLQQLLFQHELKPWRKGTQGPLHLGFLRANTSKNTSNTQIDSEGIVTCYSTFLFQHLKTAKNVAVIFSSCLDFQVIGSENIWSFSPIFFNMSQLLLSLGITFPGIFEFFLALRKLSRLFKLLLPL